MNYILNSRNGNLETIINGGRKDFKIVTTDSGYYGIILEKKIQETKRFCNLKRKKKA